MVLTTTFTISDDDSDSDSDSDRDQRAIPREGLGIVLERCKMPSSIAHISHRLRQLALTSSPTTALFYARLWHALITPTEGDHESLHILALCLLQSGQPYPALYHVRDLADADADGKGRKTIGCYGCAMIVGKCCTVLGRYSEGRPVVERASKRSTPTSKCNDGRG